MAYQFLPKAPKDRMWRQFKSLREQIYILINDQMTKVDPLKLVAMTWQSIGSDYILVLSKC